MTRPPRSSRRPVPAPAVSALAALALAGLALGARAKDAAGDTFRVHEWGTFTSLQGSDGVALEGLEHEEAHLPPFVYSRSEVRACPLRDVGWKGLECEPTGVTQKMETPVLYVHSRTPRRLRVRVDFVRGVLSQWYPVSDLLGPPERAADAGPLDVAAVERSFLEWEVDVLAPDADAPREVPRVSDADDPWLLARDVRANWLRTTPRVAPREGPVEAERYLFYRGLGAFELPLRAIAHGAGRLTLRHAGTASHDPADAIRAALALEVRGHRARLAPVGPLDAGAERAVAFDDDATPWRALDDVVSELEARVFAALVSEELHADEARAMVRTWSRSWFRAEGVRVLWIVPRPLVDALLPLRIEPVPDAVVRVLVGRLEILTPEDEAALRDALRDRRSDDAAARAAAEARIALSGRFLEAHLRRVLAVPCDDVVRASAEELLAAVDGSRER